MSLVSLIDSAGVLFEVHSLRLELQIEGAWTAHLETTAEDAIAGAVTIRIQHGDEVEQLFAGTVDDGAPYEGRAPLVVVGGAGGLLASPPKGIYYAASPSAIEVARLVNDILEDAGELPSATLVLDGYRAAAWSRLSVESHKRALTRIAHRFGLAWRVEAGGAVWVGLETWPTAELEGTELDVDTDARVVRFSFRVASARPGTTIAGRRISRVVYTDDGRGELHYEAA